MIRSVNCDTDTDTDGRLCLSHGNELHASHQGMRTRKGLTASRGEKLGMIDMTPRITTWAQMGLGIAARLVLLSELVEDHGTGTSCVVEEM